MKNWYKEAQGIPDFKRQDVRRLHGIFLDFQDLAKNADKEMQEWLEKGEYDISFEEAKERLSYFIARLGLK